MSAIERMELFGSLSTVFMAIAIIGLALSIFFFFYFDIPAVYSLMTGKAKRQTIERMAQNNSRTGHLQATSGSVRDPSVPVVQNPITGPTTAQVKSTSAQQTPAYAASTETVSLGDTPETSVLGGMAAETSVLGGAAAETSVLGGAAAGSAETAVLSAQPAPAPAMPPIRFDITESTMVLHTNEII